MNDSITGTIFDIERCSMYDGPGIRTTVFLKGCPLSCKWCHNPESQSVHPQLSFRADKCTLCGKCEELCPEVHQIISSHTVNYSHCKACGKCVASCPSDALKIIGKTTSVEDVMDIVKKDSSYYRQTGGGLTVSGGEPFAQPLFLKELLCAAKKEEIHTCIETCGYTTKQNLRSVLPYVDIFLFDYKETSPKLHEQYTGVDNEQIIEMFRFLYEQNKKIILRCPIIPGYNDTEEHFRGIAAMEQQYPRLSGIEIMPYHNLGRAKAIAVGKDYEISAPTADEALKNHWKKQLLACGCSAAVIQSF